MKAASCLGFGSAAAVTARFVSAGRRRRAGLRHYCLLRMQLVFKQDIVVGLCYPASLLRADRRWSHRNYWLRMISAYEVALWCRQATRRRSGFLGQMKRYGA